MEKLAHLRKQSVVYETFSIDALATWDLNLNTTKFVYAFFIINNFFSPCLYELCTCIIFTSAFPFPLDVEAVQLRLPPKQANKWASEWASIEYKKS